MQRTTVTSKRRLVNLFPAIEPFHQGKLQVSGLHTIHYEVCGNPIAAGGRSQRLRSSLSRRPEEPPTALLLEDGPNPARK